MLSLVTLISTALALCLYRLYLHCTSDAKVVTRIFAAKDASDTPVDNMVDCKVNILDLPDEILISVIGLLDTDSLRNVKLTTRHFKNIADPFIFEQFNVLHGSSAARLAQCITIDRHRASWIKSLLVSTRYGEDEGLHLVPLLLSQMKNMRHLCLETPDCNSKEPEDRLNWIALQKGYEEVFSRSTIALPLSERLLPNLQTCTMHFVDDRRALYPLPKYSSIFLHPTLKSLTLSCSCTDLPHRLLARHQSKYRRRTALEHLHLEECDINASSLQVLLSFPRHLKSLTISEGVRYDDGFGERSRIHGNLEPVPLAEAITEGAGDSLEFLSLCLGYRRGQRNINIHGRFLDLTGLTNLRRLEVSKETAGNLLITRPKCDHGTYKRLPPNLETLRIFGLNPLFFPALRRRPSIPFETCLIKDKVAHGVPKLAQVIWTYEHQALDRDGAGDAARDALGDEGVLAKHIASSSKYLIGHCNRSFKILKGSHVRMTLEMKETPPRFIPPYLHPEPKPRTRVLWDSNNPPIEALSARAPVHESEEDHVPAQHEEDDEDVITMPPNIFNGLLNGNALVSSPLVLRRLTLRLAWSSVVENRFEMMLTFNNSKSKHLCNYSCNPTSLKTTTMAFAACIEVVGRD